MSYMEEIQKLQAKGQLSKPVKISAQELLDVVNDRDDLSAKMGNLNAQLKEAEARAGNLATDKANLEGMLGEVSKEMETIKSQVLQYTQALTSAQDLINAREEEMNKNAAEIQNLKAQLGDNQSRLADLTGLPDSVAAKDQELTTLRGQLQALNQQFDAERQRAGSLEGQAGQITTLQSQLSQATEQVNQLNQQLNQVTQQLNQVTPQLNQANQEVARLQAEMNARPPAAELEQRDQQIANLTTQVNTLKSTIDQIQSEMATKDERIKELSQPQAVFSPSIVGKSQAAPSHYAPTFGSTAQPSMGSEPAGGPSMDLGSPRRVCPNCGSSQIKEMEDRTRIVSYIPKPMYAKKFVCRKCSFEFT